MNYWIDRCAALSAILALLPAASASAQFSGARGGVLQQPTQGVSGGGFATLSPDVAQGFITIEGKAALQVEPTEIRIVLAVTAEGKTSVECLKQIEEKVGLLQAGWKDIGIEDGNVVEDFIAVLPRYEFELQEIRAKKTAAVEQKAGYLMQSNLHLAVKNDAEAMRALKIAFVNDVADIIAFDYWSRELEDVKSSARAQAIKAAKDKSAILLEAFGDQKPPLINIQEVTNTHFPESMYVSFQNDYGEQYSSHTYLRDTPMIRTFRPKNTYYRGLYPDGDIQSKELPMRSEISVVSTVRLYFESPAAKSKRGNDDGKPRA